MYFAVVNLGLRSIRTVVFNEKGEIVSKSSLPVKTFILGSHVEQDPNEWWNGFIYTFREATKEINVRKKVKYISFTVSAACIVPVNKVGLPLYNAIMVSDKRAVKQSEKVKMTNSYKEIEKQGVKSSLYMLLEKAMWISENLKDIKNEITFFLTPNDFFIYRMTGTALTDTYNAEKFYAKGYKYPTELYNEVGLEISTFPSIASPGTLVGKAKSSVLRAVGLSQPLEVRK